MRVVPRGEVLVKLAALQKADARGRRLAQDSAVEKLAEVSGICIAQAMVQAGEITPEEYEMFKEAGFVGKVLKNLGRTAKSKATRAVSGASGTLKSRLSKSVKPTMQSRDWKTPGNVVPSRVPSRPKVQSAAQSRDWGGAGRPVSGAEYNRRASWGARQQQMQPGSASAGRPKQTQARSAVKQRQANPQQPVTKSKGVGWGRALPIAGAAGIGYGLYKGVPWAVRQLEATSTSPMAYGGGWSPVPYGYGQSAYGAGVPTMGAGA